MTKTFKLTPKLIEKMYSYGLPVSSIRKILNLTEDEYDNLLMNDKFAAAAKTGREIADFNVVEGLYRKAAGFEHEDLHFATYMGKIFKEKFKKYYPPDMTAIIFWLKNRRPNEWKEKVESAGELTNEELDALREITYERMVENL